MTEIYLIRHTQAEGNRYRMMQGSWDGEVTERGKQQIEALAQRFASLPLDAVYSSDLARAVMTAEAAARWRGLPIRTSTALRELDVGPWEQQFFGNVMWREPELARQFLHDAENWKLDGAETYGGVRTRAMAELKRIAAENERKTIAVVSHGVTIRCIMSGITGIPLSDTKRIPIYKNTAVTKLLWNGSGFEIVYMNDDSHLPESLRSSWNTAGDLRDVVFDPMKDRDFYEACYADAWRSAHGNLNGYSPEPYFSAAKRHHELQAGSVLRIFHQEKPVGLVDLDPERGESEGIGWISLLFLKEEYRNQGYGIQLLARAIFFYKALGRRCLQLQVAEENCAACAFYRREGFHWIGERKTQNGKLFLAERTLGQEWIKETVEAGLFL